MLACFLCLEEIGAERNVSGRAEHASPNDEIGQLRVTFNSMLTDFETAFRQPQQALESQRPFVAGASRERRISSPAA
jgi:hypothetical protein